MRVLILSTFESQGGAAKAAQRLCKALNRNGITAKLGFVLANKGAKKEAHYVHFAESFFKRVAFWYQFILERIKILLIISERKYLFKYSIAHGGLDLLNHPEVKKADVVHLHWINFGLLSLKTILILSQTKRLVWTLHDFWLFTGGCHLPMGCRLFQNGCNKCFYLNQMSHLSEQILIEKKDFLKSFKGTLVTVSDWMKRKALSSSVLRDTEVLKIGNPLDTTTFQPLSQMKINSLRQQYNITNDTFCILAGAADLKDQNKGFRYVIELMNYLKVHRKEKFLLLIFGRSEFLKKDLLWINNIQFGTIRDESQMTEIYNMANLFILPSLQESLSYTAMESLACGIPVVAFDSGGVRDLVIHKETGYLAKVGDQNDLINGVIFLLERSQEYLRISCNGRRHVEVNYSEEIIARSYISLYNS